MNDLLIVVGVLFLIIIGQAVERFFYTQQTQKEKDKLLEELSRATKAVISKNANEYVMTTSIDKVAPETKPAEEPDLIPEEVLTDDEFFAGIQKQNKEIKK